jgi:serine/threonine-protein kinase ATR
MISTLSEEEIGNLVDPTFAIIAQHWELFSPKIQAHTHDAISRLLKTHSGIVRQNVRTIPSLASIPLMAKFEEELGKIKAQMDIKHQYQAFSERCQSENVTVVVSALKELETFLIKHQRFLHEVATQEQPDPVVAQLIRSILDACVLLGETHEDVPILSAKCLGLIGCVDPTRIEAVKDKKGILVLSNFGEAEETKDFVVFAFREVLVKSFLSAISSRSQGFLAWAMQELLQFIQFDTSVMVRSRNIPHDANYLRWMTLPESVRNTLTPFMTSKYVITEGFKQAPCIYPLFRSSMTHQQWLRTFTLDLLQKGEGENIAQIFHVFSRIIRTQDVSISDFILPFAALNMIINGAEPGRLNVTEELLHVLNITLPESDSQERADLILCSQVSEASRML